MSVVIDTPQLVVGRTTGPNPEPPTQIEGGGSVMPQAAMFATTREQRVRELRHDYVRRAIEWLRLGSRDEALLLMLDCLRAQARISGIRSEDL